MAPFEPPFTFADMPLRQAFDLMPYAIFWTAADLSVLACNARAEILIATGDGVAVVNGRLAFDDTAAEEALHAMRSNGPGPDNGGPACRTVPFRARRPSFETPYAAFVSPLAPDTLLLRIVDPAAGSAERLNVLRGAWSLTWAEATILDDLCDGYTIRQIAGRRNIAYGTARNHLKGIFLKTGCLSQSEVVASTLRMMANVV